jgi:uncharacterized membrane protein YebE (DUF533 family)
MINIFKVMQYILRDEAAHDYKTADATQDQITDYKTLWQQAYPLPDQYRFERIIDVMVAAAFADRHISISEQDRIRYKMQMLDMPENVQSYLKNRLAHPDRLDHILTTLKHATDQNMLSSEAADALSKDMRKAAAFVIAESDKSVQEKFYQKLEHGLQNIRPT